jgi:hypothetical protein
VLKTVGQRKQTQSNKALDHLHEDVRLLVTSIAWHTTGGSGREARSVDPERRCKLDTRLRSRSPLLLLCKGFQGLPRESVEFAITVSASIRHRDERMLLQSGAG